MRLIIKKDTSIPEIISDRFSLESMKRIVNNQIGKIDSLGKILTGELKDEEYLSEFSNVYELSFGEIGGYEIIYTDIPFGNPAADRPNWQYRAYEVITPENFNKDELYSKVHDEESIRNLVEKGVILVDMIPYGYIRNKFGLMLRNSDGNKILTLANMPRGDEYTEKLIKAFKAYPTDLIMQDRSILVRNLKSKLDYLKRWAKASSELTKERLNVEEEIAAFCQTKQDDLVEKHR